MGEMYPFPIPEAIKNLVRQRMAGSCYPWTSLEQWSEDKHEPAMLGYFDCWRDRTISKLKALEMVLDHIEGDRLNNEIDLDQWHAVIGAVHSLRTMLLQLGGLLEWAKLTWKHDPSIQGPYKGVPTPEDPEESVPVLEAVS